MPPVILCFGNPDRGDDAAGALVARELNLPVSEPAAILDLDPHAHVILVDAVVTGSAPGTIHTWDARALPLPRETFRCSTHALGVAEAVEMARALGRLPASMTIYGIEGAQFEFGTQPRAEVAAAARELARKLSAQCSGSE
ncbi:MAG: hydrogenase maturation protease [Acidobacteriales bacterium]|nr:hydrogenase maturation protease [Terriglobales bacterium]